MLYGLEDPTCEYKLGFQKSEDEKSFNSPLMGGPIMLEKPLKRVSRPNADVRLSNLVGGNTNRHIRIHIYVYILYIYINTYRERKRPKYEIES